MDKFRRTSIRSKKKNSKSSIEGDLVESGALIFTKTQVDMQTIRRGDAFWRLLIRMIQWFRWSRTKGDPSTITHVDGWDGKLAFGSDLCDPEGGGLNRHVLPIVPHCFTKAEGCLDELKISRDHIEVVNKKKRSHVIRIEDLATCDFEVIQLPEFLKKDFLKYQEKFRNDDIRYSLKKAAKTVITNAKFCSESQKIAIADAIYAYLEQPFRNKHGDVIQTCCSTFLAKILMAIEHKQRIVAFIDSEDFELKTVWKRDLFHLEKGFKALNKIHEELICLEHTFDKKWKDLEEQKHKESSSQLIELCLDFSENRNFLIRRIRRISANLSKRIYKMADDIMNAELYSKYFDQSNNPLIFKLNPERVTPAKLFYYLVEILENEP